MSIFKKRQSSKQENVDENKQEITRENGIDNLTNTSDMYGKLSCDVIMKSIPSDAHKHKIEEYSNHMTEYRWRIMSIPCEGNKDRHIIEISRKAPNQPRLFVDHSNNWKEQNTEEYDKYVIEEYYYYH